MDKRVAGTQPATRSAQQRGTHAVSGATSPPRS